MNILGIINGDRMCAILRMITIEALEAIFGIKHVISGYVLRVDSMSGAIDSIPSYI